MTREVGWHADAGPLELLSPGEATPLVATTPDAQARMPAKGDQARAEAAQSEKGQGKAIKKGHRKVHRRKERDVQVASDAAHRANMAVLQTANDVQCALESARELTRRWRRPDSADVDRVALEQQHGEHMRVFKTLDRFRRQVDAFLSSEHGRQLEKRLAKASDVQVLEIAEAAQREIYDAMPLVGAHAIELRLALGNIKQARALDRFAFEDAGLDRAGLRVAWDASLSALLTPERGGEPTLDARVLREFLAAYVGSDAAKSPRKREKFVRRLAHLLARRDSANDEVDAVIEAVLGSLEGKTDLQRVFLLRDVARVEKVSQVRREKQVDLAGNLAELERRVDSFVDENPLFGLRLRARVRDQAALVHAKASQRLAAFKDALATHTQVLERVRLDLDMRDEVVVRRALRARQKTGEAVLNTSIALLRSVEGRSGWDDAVAGPTLELLSTLVADLRSGPEPGATGVQWHTLQIFLITLSARVVELDSTGASLNTLRRAISISCDFLAHDRHRGASETRGRRVKLLERRTHVYALTEALLVARSDGGEMPEERVRIALDVAREISATGAILRAPDVELAVTDLAETHWRGQAWTRTRARVGEILKQCIDSSSARPTFRAVLS